MNSFMSGFFPAAGVAVGVCGSLAIVRMAPRRRLLLSAVRAAVRAMLCMTLTGRERKGGGGRRGR